MKTKIIAAAATAIALAVLMSAPAQAYTLHTWSDGTISWMCNDGITVGVMEDGSVPPESVIIAACAGHGGMATSPFGSKTSKIERARR